MSFPPSTAALEPRPLPFTGVTRLHQYYGPLRHPTRPGPAPHGTPVGACHPTVGTSRVAFIPLFMRAAATTPAEPTRARVARFPVGGSLRRYSGGSAPASPVSRPAQRSLALRPACSLSRPWRPVPSKCFRRCRYLLRPLRLLPAGATVAGRVSHPLGNDAFHGALNNPGLEQLPGAHRCSGPHSPRNESDKKSWHSFLSDCASKR